MANGMLMPSFGSKSKERLETLSYPKEDEDNGAKEVIIQQYMEKGI